ncbi:MAG: hypothetical protein AAB486_01285 [Patescibacteria group bacterium]
MIRRLQDVFGDLSLAIEMAQGIHGRGAPRQTINVCLNQTVAIVNSEGKKDDKSDSQNDDAPEAG